MRYIQYSLVWLLIFSGMASLHAAENLPVDIYNFLRLEYDDNVFTSNDDLGKGPVDSVVIVEQVEFLLDSRQNNTYYGLRYSPSFHYYFDRPDDDSDLNHQWDLILEQDFSPRTNAQLKHTLRVSNESELVEDDVTLRRNNDYMYNAVDGSFTTQVLPEKTSLRARADFSDFSYDQDDVAKANDYQQLGGGLDVIQTLTPDSSLTGVFGYREIDYETDFRDAKVLRIAASYSKVFNPKFQGIFTLGWEQQNSDDPVTEDIDTPYVDLSLVLAAAKSTSLTVGGGYGIEKSPVNTFSAQERARIFARLNHDITAATTFIFQGTYTSGSFDADSATSLFDPAVDVDGDENTVQILTALNYDLNVRNSLELAWRYTDLESDVRPASDYDRNRYYFGWKYRL